MELVASVDDKVGNNRLAQAEDKVRELERQLMEVRRENQEYKVERKKADMVINDVLEKVRKDIVEGNEKLIMQLMENVKKIEESNAAANTMKPGRGANGEVDVSREDGQKKEKMETESEDKEVLEDSGDRELVVTDDIPHQDHASVAVMTSDVGQEKGHDRVTKVVPASIKSELGMAVETRDEDDPGGDVEEHEEEKEVIVGEKVAEKVDEELPKNNVNWRPRHENWFSKTLRKLDLEEQRKCAK